MAFCPQKIIAADRTGKPEIIKADRCVGCRFCEVHCPDFAITISERKPKRRKNDV
jgi:2-oxoglutarate ferredoxin oxidoreductase subunit delta